MVPIAGLIGDATEHLAYHLGPRWGGLLNVTFGNGAELILTLLAVRSGLLTLVKAPITGSIIGNTLFALGVSLLIGGLRHGRLCFDARRTSGAAAMMILAIAGLYSAPPSPPSRWGSPKTSTSSLIPTLGRAAFVHSPVLLMLLVSSFRTEPAG